MVKKNKINILIGILVLLLIVIIGYGIYWYLFSEGYCDNWAERNNIVKPACIGHWERKGFACSWICETIPLEESLVGGCASVSLENRQECCDNWAEENNIVHIQCVGKWVIENNKCKWECETG